MIGPAAARRVIALLLLVGGAWSPGPDANCRGGAERRIRYYRKQTTRHPGLYPAYAQLGAAQLDQARATADPTLVAACRAALQRSLDLQPTYEALSLMASVASYAHRFDEALEWADRAAAASPAEGPDPQLLSMKVDALIALGREDEAGRLLETAPQAAGGNAYHLAVARGQWLKAAGRHDEAIQEFGRAAGLARAVGAQDLEAWSEIAVAGQYLDTARPKLAAPRLEAARRIDPCRKDLRIHEAERLTAEGHPREALEVYQTLLKEAADPAVAHRAFNLATTLSLTRPARRHYRTADEGYRRAIDAGEVYTLGALAQLLLDAGRDAPRALALARQNLMYKRDREARATYDAALALVAPGETPATTTRPVDQSPCGVD